MPRKPLLSLVACLSLLTLVACEHKGPGERAGEKVDHAVDALKNGGHEPIHDKLQDKADKATDKIDKAAGNPP